jgi:phosphate transport system substrate-binding protein
VNLLLLAALAAAAAPATSAQLPALAISVRIDGSRSLLPLASALRNALRDQSEDADVALGAGLGTESQIDALATGAIDIALASHSPDPGELTARGLVAHRVAVAAVVFAVHADVGVLDLRPAALCDIFSGKIANWEALGGPSIPIKAFLRPESEADMEIARSTVACLRDLLPGPAVTVAPTAADMRVALQSTPGAIGLTTAGAVRQSIVALRMLAIGSVSPAPENVLNGRYPLVRAAYLLTRASPPASVERFVEFVRSERGAAAIREAGALPVR